MQQPTAWTSRCHLSFDFLNLGIQFHGGAGIQFQFRRMFFQSADESCNIIAFLSVSLTFMDCVACELPCWIWDCETGP